jgi:hypothetical protein
VVWSSEGARVINKISRFYKILRYKRQLQPENSSTNTLPTNLNMQKKRSPKQWRSEGLTFNNNYSTLFTNVEEPLYEDSQCLNNKGGMIRLPLMQKR